MPANATYVRTSIEMLAAVLASSSGNAAHIQLTMPQRSIQSTTVLKHRRTVEDLLLKSKLVPDMHTSLLFERPESSQNDRRSLTQTCILSTFQSFSEPAFLASTPAIESRLGPFPLIKVANMLGCDEDSRPGPGTRVEQCLGLTLSLRPSANNRVTLGHSLSPSQSHSGRACHCMGWCWMPTLKDFGLQEDDRAICFDMVPNRQDRFSQCNFNPKP